MPLLTRWTFTTWWALAALAWALTARLGAAPALRAQLEWLAPLWGAPWALPLAAVRALGPEAGVPFGFEIALLVGLAGCLLLDIRRRARSVVARADWSVAAEG